MRVRSVLGAPTQCLLAWDVDELRPGRAGAGDALRVEVGGARRPLFVGEVTVVERGYGADRSREVRVRAYDALHRLRKRQATRTFEEVDLLDLARRLTAGTGLEVSGPAVRLGTVHQYGRSDLEALVLAATRVGVWPVVDGTTLRLVDLGGDGDDPLELRLGTSLHSAEIEVSQEPSYREVVVTSWDPASARAEVERAGGVAARARTRADPAPQSVGGGGALTVPDEVVGEAELALALARAELSVRAAGEVTASLVAEGDPRLRAGVRVSVAGVDPLVEGVYLVTEAVHVVDAGGYETTLSTRPPEPPSTRGADRVTLGLVSDTADPEERARVRVRLAALPDLETGWAPVLLPAAGPGKGAVLLPEVGDTVLTLLAGGDAAQAVVLGGLYGEGRVPDAGEGGPRGSRLTVRTADGQQVRLDGAGHRVQLDDGHGSSVELGPELVRITAATDLLIEAPGHGLRVRARTVDFEEA